MLGAMDDERRFVGFCPQEAAKQAFAGGICASNIGVTPGRKEEVHGPSKDIRRTRVLSNFSVWQCLTVPESVVIVEGVLWPFQDCRKIRPLVSEPSAKATEVNSCQWDSGVPGSAFSTTASLQ